MTKVYSPFPGTGKSHFSKTSKLVVSDSDSSKFDKNYFPENYIEHIKNLYEPSKKTQKSLVDV